MTQSDFPAPGASLSPIHPSADTLAFLSHRRSVTAGLLAAPGPNAETLDRILQTASRVPDHRKMVPFRFMVFEGEAREAFGDVLQRAAAQREDSAGSAAPETIRTLFCRAPVVVAVISVVDPAHKTPEWEQILTSGAVCFQMLLAASASGYAGQWLTEWYAYDAEVIAAMGLGPQERVAGFIYMGTATTDPKERARPNAQALTTRWSANV